MNEKTITLTSQIDPCVNNYKKGFETRFVCKEESVTIYLSSFKGCDQACQMCHLTQSAQTDMTPATLQDFFDQARYSLQAASSHFDENHLPWPKHTHFSFMANGEPLLNDTIMKNWGELSNSLLTLALEYSVTTEVKFKISTIMTGIYIRDEDGVIVDGYTDLPFTTNKPEIYYSLYSMDDTFRKRWLPKADVPHEMLRVLSNYISKGGLVRLHSAFILGHNDDLVDIQKIIQAVNFFGIPRVYDIIRFDSPDTSRWVESPQEHILEIKKYLESKKFEVQIVDRVGEDIFAS